MFPSCLVSAGYSVLRLLPYEPHADPSARSQRATERGRVPEGNRALRGADSQSGRRDRLKVRPCAEGRGGNTALRLVQWDWAGPGKGDVMIAGSSTKCLNMFKSVVLVRTARLFTGAGYSATVINQRSWILLNVLP